MNRFQDHPVFASSDTPQPTLSAAEIAELRKLLDRENNRVNVATTQNVFEEPDGQFDYAKIAERIYRSRRDRERVFNDSIFADPAWDLLLDLFVKSLRNEQVSVSSACYAASVPEATALRYLKVLTEKKYVERISHPHDKRSTTLKMTPLGLSLMTEWLELFRSHR